MSLFRKVIGADPHRKSRFRDEQNQFIPLSEFGLLPLRIKERVARKFGIYPAKPWWPDQARQRIEKILEPDWLVVEFGSGMSTAWLAKRCRQVVAVESNQHWYKKVVDDLRANGIRNVEVRFFNLSEYDNLTLPLSEYPDLVIVDGERRRECIRWAFDHVKPGGYLYLDNADRPGTEPNTDGYQARPELLSLVRERSAEIEFLRGIPPGLLASTHGALVRLPK